MCSRHCGSSSIEDLRVLSQSLLCFVFKSLSLNVFYMTSQLLCADFIRGWFEPRATLYFHPAFLHPPAHKVKRIKLGLSQDNCVSGCTTIGAQGEVESAKFFYNGNVPQLWCTDNFYNKDILKNFWETCFVSAVGRDKGMRAESELTMTWTHSNERSMMHALANNWISHTSCSWNNWLLQMYFLPMN